MRLRGFWSLALVASGIIGGAFGLGKPTLGHEGPGRLGGDLANAQANVLAVLGPFQHGLRHPIDLLRMGIADEGRAKTSDYAERISVSARHLAQLIEEAEFFR